MPIYEVGRWTESILGVDPEVKIDPNYIIGAASYEEALEILHSQYLPQALNPELLRIVYKTTRTTDDNEVEIFYYPSVSPNGEAAQLIYCFAPILREREGN